MKVSGKKKATCFYTFKFLVKKKKVILVSVQFVCYTFERLPKKGDCMYDY